MKEQATDNNDMNIWKLSVVVDGIMVLFTATHSEFLMSTDKNPRERKKVAR